MKSVVEQGFSTNLHLTTKHLQHPSIANLLKTFEVRTLSNSNSNFVTSLPRFQAFQKTSYKMF